MRVLLDTNALMMPAQVSLDLFDELSRLIGAYEPVVLESSVRELELLSRKLGRQGAAARFGQTVAHRCRVIPAGPADQGSVDEQVLAYADRNACLVVTNDRPLRERLLARGIGVISLRKQKRLELITS